MSSESGVVKKGVVKWWDNQKGYGFIVGNHDNKDIFVHYTGIRGSGYRSLNMGDEVEYIEGQNAKGVCAEDVNVTKSAAFYQNNA